MTEKDLWDAVVVEAIKRGTSHEWAIIAANEALAARRKAQLNEN